MNNANKQQFKNREASFSTHGSRRGYSDLGEQLTNTDFLPLKEKRSALIANKLIIEKRYINSKTKNNLDDLNEINKKLTDVNVEIRTHNTSSEGVVDSVLNKGVAFMKTAREVLDKDMYRMILHKALNDYDLTEDRNTISKT